MSSISDTAGTRLKKVAEHVPKGKGLVVKVDYYVHVGVENIRDMVVLVHCRKTNCSEVCKKNNVWRDKREHSKTVHTGRLHSDQDMEAERKKFGGLTQEREQCM